MGHQIVHERASPACPRQEPVEPTHPRKTAFAGMALGSLGVVFGDIGTSPLYALRESLNHIK
ncbi:MAG TPA: KUP/HAK/KT family potassium transporter, partial [Methylocella sp.]|nr:KUP/HAK/KT family potassium transporter [Methylocella sp.]